MYKEYIILGEPIPLKKQPQIVRKANQSFIPETPFCIQIKEKSEHQNIIKAQHGDDPFLEGPLKINIYFYLKKPYKGRQDSGYHDKLPLLRDLTNYIIDIMSGICFAHEAQVVSINPVKYWASDQANTHIEIVELYEKNIDAGF